MIFYLIFCINNNVFDNLLVYLSILLVLVIRKPVYIENNRDTAQPVQAEQCLCCSQYS